MIWYQWKIQGKYLLSILINKYQKKNFPIKIINFTLTIPKKKTNYKKSLVKMLVKMEKSKKFILMEKKRSYFIMELKEKFKLIYNC